MTTSTRTWNDIAKRIEEIEVQLGLPGINYPKIDTYDSLNTTFPAEENQTALFTVTTTTGIIGFRKLAGIYQSQEISPGNWGWVYLGYDRNASSIKLRYESNPDTNVFTDEEKADLAINTSLSHSHNNKVELDKISDGDHDLRKDNPHELTKAHIDLENVSNLLNNYDAESAPTSSDDNSKGYSVGSRWIIITTKKEYVCLNNDENAAIWAASTGSGGGSINTAVSASFTGNDVPYVEMSVNTEYGAMARLPFAGSDEIGTPKSIYLNIWRDGSGANYDIRIYDITNSTVIAENTDLSNENDSLDIQFTSDNISTGRAVFEIQAKKNGDGSNPKIDLATALMEF